MMGAVKLRQGLWLIRLLEEELVLRARNEGGHSGCRKFQFRSGPPSRRGINQVASRAWNNQPGSAFEAIRKMTDHFFLLTAAFSSAPGENLATFLAEILMGAPVCGFRPVRALRPATEKVPNPTRVTRPPFFKSPWIPDTRELIAHSACVLLIPAF